ncbi:ArnT family glycosyltransferase [Candidatus Omnitrophota bacterium]
MRFKISKSALPIAFVLILGALLRFWGLKYGYPYSIGHFDEVFGVRYAVSFGVTRSLRPEFFFYPAFYFYFLFSLYAGFFILGSLAGWFSNLAEFAFIYLTHPGTFYLIGRAASAVLGSCTIAIIYLIGKKAYGRTHGLIAAILLSFCYTHAYRSHLATADVTMVFLCCLSFFFIYNVFTRAKLKDYLLAGLLAGLATSTKYMSFLLILPLSLAHLCSARNCARPWLKRLWSRKLIFAYLLLVAGFILGSPYWVLDFKSYFYYFRFDSSLIGKFGMIGYSKEGLWLRPLAQLAQKEYLLGISFIVGTIYALIRPQRRDWIFLSFILPSFLYLGHWTTFKFHYLLVILPFCAILAARLLIDLPQRLMPGKKAFWLSSILVILILLPSGYKIADLNWRMSHPDVRIIAKEWIENNIPQGTKIALFVTRYRDCPQIVSQLGEFDSIDYGPRARKTYANPALSELLDQYFSQQKTYKIYRLEKQLSDAAVAQILADFPAEYQQDPYLKHLYQRDWHSLAELKIKGVEYIIISSFTYGKYFGVSAPEEGNPTRPFFLKGRSYYQMLLSSPELQLVKEFQPGANNLGPELKLIKIRD